MQRSPSGSQKPRAKKIERTTISAPDIYSTSPGRYTRRSFIRTGRIAWRTLRQLRGLTPLEFRGYLTKDLKELSLGEEVRQSILRQAGNAPAEDDFWLTVEDVWQDFLLAEETSFWLDALLAKYAPPKGSWFWQLRRHVPLDPLSRWDRLFRQRFAQRCKKPAPPAWTNAAITVMVQILSLRSQANGWLQRRSVLLRSLWERGKAAGLLSAVREGLITERWVAQAVADLQGKKTQGDEHADKLLEQVSVALGEVGSGRPPKLSPQERQSHRQASNYTAGTARNQQQAALRLAHKIRDQEAWLLDHGRTPTQARREALRVEIAHFQETSRARDKPAILAMLKEILAHD